MMKFTYRLENLGCAACAAKMERAISKIDGVSSASIVFMTTRMTIDADETKIKSIEAEAEKMIRKIEPDVRMKKV